MSSTLTVVDETVGGDRDFAIELSFPTERITVRELIRERVYQEVQDHNLHKSSRPNFRGLVQPTDAERTLNGYQLKKPRLIDWKPQYEKAIAGFEKNHILILIDEVQADSLDQSIELTRGVEVSFLKLTPLVGG